MRRYWWILALLAGFVTNASAGEKWRLSHGRDRGPAPCLPDCQPAKPETPPGTPPEPPSAAAQPPSVAPFSAALASAGESGTQPAGSYMPGFFGDLLGSCAVTSAAVPVPLGSLGGTFLVQRNICSIDVSQASAIKIADSDSPRPLDRVYYLYNFFGAIPVDPVPVTPPSPDMNVHRHVIGFEKTFWGGDASIGMRLPFFGLTGSFAYDNTFTGDLTILTKFALVNNPDTGNVLSAGLCITTPTGGEPDFILLGRIQTRQPQPRNFPVILQPWLGYIYYVSDRLYAHAFHSVLVPTDSREPTFMANDVGVGYWLYRNPDDSFVRGVVPTFELHVNTPFDHRQATGLVGDVHMEDSVNLTSGLYVLFPRSIFGGSVSVPLAFGPHAIEALASYTLRF